MANQEINIVIKAIDKFSKNFKGVNKSLSNLSRKAKENAGSFKKATAIGGVGLAGLVYQVKGLTDAYKIQESAEKQVAKGIETTGGVAGKTLDELKKQASEFQKNSIFGDEDILQNVSAQFLTFGNITEETFNRGQKAVLDLTTRLYGAKATGEQLRTTSIQLGKALNDPIKGVTALSRVGVAFTDQQKEEIKTLTQSGKLKEAQAIVLKELEVQYGGSAKATAEALGPTHQLTKSWGDMKEDLGRGLIPAINELASSLAPLVEKISNWVKDNPKLFKNIVLVTGGVLGLSVVIGTLGLIIPTLVKGFQSMILVTKGLGVALRFLALNPIGLIITAIAGLVVAGVLVYKNWDKIKKGAKNLGNGILNLYEKYKWLFRIFTPFLAVGVEIYKNWDKIKEKAKDLWAWIGNLGNRISSGFTDLVSSAKNWGANMIQMFVEGLKAKVKAVKDGILEIAGNIKDFLGFSSPTKKGPGKNADKWMPNLINMLKDGLDKGSKKIEDMSKKIGGKINDGVNSFSTDEIKDALEELSYKAQDSISNITEKFQSNKDKITDTINKIKDLSTEFNNFKKDGERAILDVNRQIKDLKDSTGKINLDFEINKDKKLSERFLNIEDKLKDKDLKGEERTKLEDEKKFILQNTTEEQIEQARLYKEMSESAKIVLDLEKQRNEALTENKRQTEVLLEKRALLEIQSSQNGINDRKIQIKEEEGILKGFYENKKGELVEIKNFENILLAEEINNKQAHFQKQTEILTGELEKQKIAQKETLLNMQNEYALYNDFLDKSTKETTLKMINSLGNLESKLKRVISLRSKVGFSTKDTSNIDGKRENGGLVSAGKTYLVGERGPELFTPAFTGNITPNNQLGNSQTININVTGNNISNEADENRLVLKIKESLSNELRLASFGIS